MKPSEGRRGPVLECDAVGQYGRCDSVSDAWSIGSRALPALIRWHLVAMLAFAVLSVATTCYFLRVGPHEYPYTWPLFQGGSYQFDFLCFQKRFQYFHTPEFFTYPERPPFTYPATLAIVFEMFYGFCRNPHTAFVCFSILAYVGATCLFGLALRAHVRTRTALACCLIPLLCAYPVALQLFLANVEVVVWVLTAVGIWAWWKDRRTLAAVCFGLVGSMKIFPLIYLGLLLSARRYKALGIGIATFIVTSTLSLWVVGPDLPTAYHGIQAGIKYFQDDYVYQFNPKESGMDHSLFGLIKIPIAFTKKQYLLRQMAGPYLATVALLGTVLYFRRIRHLPRLNQLIALSVASILLPQVSHDYTLLHLYAPWVLLLFFILRCDELGTLRKPVSAMLICFLLLFSDENYLIVHYLRFAGQMKAIVLLTLFVLALRYRLRDQPKEVRSTFDAGAVRAASSSVRLNLTVREVQQG